MGDEVDAGVGSDGAAAVVAHAGDHVGQQVAVEDLVGDPDAAAVVDVAGEEVGVQLRVDDALREEVVAVEDLDARPAARPGAGDQVAETVAVHVADGHISSVAERIFEDEEVGGEVLEGQLGERFAVPEGDARSALEAGGDGDVGVAVAVDVADGGAGAAAEGRVVDAEVAEHRGETAAGIDDNPRAAALVRAEDQFVEAVAVDIAGGHEHAAREVFEGERGKERLPGLAVEDRDLGRDARAGADREVEHAVVIEVGGHGADAAAEVRVEGEERRL